MAKFLRLCPKMFMITEALRRVDAYWTWHVNPGSLLILSDNLTLNLEIRWTKTNQYNFIEEKVWRVKRYFWCMDRKLLNLQMKQRLTYTFLIRKRKRIGSNERVALLPIRLGFLFRMWCKSDEFPSGDRLVGEVSPEICLPWFFFFYVADSSRVVTRLMSLTLFRCLHDRLWSLKANIWVKNLSHAAERSLIRKYSQCIFYLWL